ncbi:MAG: hypothetical protein K0U84_13425 [Actinomycetia bacterium]|nr:hypothetical protein [Actinomycetes bacterium]
MQFAKETERTTIFKATLSQDEIEAILIRAAFPRSAEKREGAVVEWMVNDGQVGAIVATTVTKGSGEGNE